MNRHNQLTHPILTSIYNIHRCSGLSREKFLVVGGGGQTTLRVAQALKSLNIADANVMLTTRNQLDLAWEPHRFRDQIQGLIGQFQPTVFILTAALTNVELCEKDPKLNELINVTNTQVALGSALEAGARVVFFSTDYVFDGLYGPYSEDTPTKALSLYGAAKVTIEQFLSSVAPDRSLIVRTTGVYDGLVGSKNFVMQAWQAAKEGRAFRLPADQFANPTWALDLACATLGLVNGGASGIYHVAGKDYLNRVQWFRTILGAAGVPIEKIDILAESYLTKDLGQVAARPLRGGLKIDKVRTFLNWEPEPSESILKGLWHDLNEV